MYIKHQFLYPRVYALGNHKLCKLVLIIREGAGTQVSQRLKGSHREAKLSCVLLTGGDIRHLPVCWNAGLGGRRRGGRGI